MIVEKIFNYISKLKIIHTIFQEAVVKSCENDFSIYNSCCKSESRISHKCLKSHITKQLLTSISVDIRIYLPSKVIFTSALRPR